MTQTNIEMSYASVPKPKHVLLGEQTAWTLLANIVHIYRHHFSVVVGAAGVPFVLPAIIVILAWSNLIPEESQAALIVAAVLLFYIFYLFLVPAALTVVLSDICLGNAPTLKRAFVRVLGQRRWWHLFTTAMLVALAGWLGLILLIVPGLWILVRTLFAMPIVVLEDRRNRDAIRRSFALTKGKVLRIAGLYFLTPLVFVVLSSLIGVVVALTAAATGLESVQLVGVLKSLTNLIIFILATPAFLMLIVLLYYAERVRRESYDAQALVEDLMR
jgi:membrane-anchored glycerophosphoryl diester phosphodiesterase (GDPDase)